MSIISKYKTGFVYQCWQHSWETQQDPSKIEKQFYIDLASSNLTTEDLKNSTIILVSVFEGHTDASIHFLVELLSSITSIKNIRSLFTAVFDTSSLPYKSKTIPLYLTSHRTDIQTTNFNDKDKTQVTHKFLCLARRPNVIRAKTIGKLISSNILSLQYSFGGGNAFKAQYYSQYFPNIKLPVILGDESELEYWNSQYFELGYKSLFNIIIETSSQASHEGWTSIFFTEKTFKTFSDWQLPLWMAPTGSVAEFRKFGFDLYDDIIDHSYDTIYDENARMNALISEVQRLDLKYSIGDCQELRDNLEPRIQKNFELLKGYALNTHSMYHNALTELLQ